MLLLSYRFTDTMSSYEPHRRSCLCLLISLLNFWSGETLSGKSSESRGRAMSKTETAFYKITQYTIVFLPDRKLFGQYEYWQGKKCAGLGRGESE